MIPDPPAGTHRADTAARSTAILAMAEPSDHVDEMDVGPGRSTGSDVVLVEARGRSAGEVRELLGLIARRAQGGAGALALGVLCPAGDAVAAAVDAGATYVVDTGGVEPGVLAAVARRQVVIVVSQAPTQPAAGVPAPPDQTVSERHSAVLAAGAPPGAVVLELPVGSAASAAASQARDAGSPVGVVVDGPTHQRRLGETATAPGDVERGREIALLTSDLVAGAATVRTVDPHRARRVRAVVAWLVASAIGEGEADLADVAEELGAVSP